MGAPFRFPRAVAVTASMAVLAAGAHVLAGGTLPGPGIAAGICAVMLAPVMLLTATKINAPTMVVALGAAQIFLHGAFNAFSISASGFSPAAGEHFHGPIPSVLPPPSLMAGHTADPETLMVVLHTGATLMTALILARGEAALWALASWLRPLIRLLTGIVIHPLGPLPAWPGIAIAPRWRTLRLPALRGPPPLILVR
ncbi:hypothetical protein ACX5I6_20065 [Arthrobacter sp. MMS24-T111]